MKNFTLQDLINLINNAHSLNESERKEYLDAVNNGAMTPEMGKRLQEVFTREVEELEDKIKGWEGEIKEQKEVKEKETAKITPKLNEIATQGRKEMDEEVTGYKQDLENIEKEVDTNLQTEAAQEDKEEADEIRKNLGLK